MRVAAILLGALALAAGGALAATALLDGASGADDPVGNLSPVGSIGSTTTGVQTETDAGTTTEATTDEGRTETTDDQGGDDDSSGTVPLLDGQRATVGRYAPPVALSDQRVSPTQPRKAGEVRVRRAELGIVLYREAREVCINRQVPGSAEWLEQLSEQDGVSRAGMEHRRAGRTEPGAHDVERLVDAKRRLEDPRVRAQPNECEQGHPREAERLDAGEALLEPRPRPFVVRRCRVVCVEQQVDVGDDHLRSSSLRNLPDRRKGPTVGGLHDNTRASPQIWEWLSSRMRSAAPW
jgi:hypothetical protein